MPLDIPIKGVPSEQTLSPADADLLAELLSDDAAKNQRAYEEAERAPDTGKAGIVQHVVHAVASRETPQARRFAAGRALARLGDPRPGVGLKDDLPDILWCHVPAGTLTMGTPKGDPDADDDESDPDGKTCEVHIAQFALAAYPVTNAQFRPFIEGGGYSNDAYWTPAGWEWRQDETITEPRFWADPRWNALNHPVVGVSWYEAHAYSQWLALALTSAGKLPQGATLRLPTDAEWEWAARGDPPRTYPWGDAWDPAACNSGQARLGRTCAVGLFPQGVSAWLAAKEQQVYDLAGNVWDWTQSLHLPYPYSATDGPENLDAAGGRVTRGGSWDLDADYCRCACRYCITPEDSYDSLGFRVARPLP